MPDKKITRRAAVLALGLPAMPRLHAAPLKKVGLQLYTLRNVLPKAPDATLEQVAKIGYQEVEAIRDSLALVAPIARRLKLDIPSCHFEAAVITGRWRNAKPITIQQAADEIKGAGARYALMPWVDVEDRGGGDVFRALADKMNQAAEVCRKTGLQFCYHHHAFEFAPVEGQKTGMDIFLERFDAKLVQLEVDMFWLKVAGQDPVQFLQRVKGRAPLLHVKDIAPGAPVQFNERLAPDIFKEVGSGTLNVQAVLKAAMAAGTKHFIVEQDQCPGDPLESVRKSFEYLKTVQM
jgi:sugar phosphate isomerase/epimerase